MVRCWEVPGPTRRVFCRPLAKHDHYDCAGKKIIEKQGIKDIKDIKDIKEGQASWQSANPGAAIRADTACAIGIAQPLS
jgi:hypothetical protein